MSGRMRLLHGDALEQLRTLESASVHSVVTDPPAGIGFMGKAWDGDKGGRDQWIAWLTGVMQECRRVLKPGGHALVWALPRTSHWTATAVEDAGFEIRDVVTHLFGTGFPKSLNLKGEWSGWGTALKPASEHWILTRKPLVGTVAANVLEHGCGALNVDGCRIGNGGQLAWQRPRDMGYMGGSDAGPVAALENALGRWPANVTLDEEAAAALDEQSGTSTSPGCVTRGGKRSGLSGLSGLSRQEHVPCPSDSGGASRFFYTAKAARKERGRGNLHPTVKPFALMRWLVRLITPPGGTVLDPFMGSGSTALACRREGFGFIGIECEPESVATAEQRVHGELFAPRRASA